MSTQDSRLREQHLVSAAELADLVESGHPDVVVLDVRFEPGRTDGRERYDAGHIPGAIFVDLPGDLAGPADPALGRRPVPSAAQIQQTLRRWGVNVDSQVVLYDDRRNLSAGRGWWLLRWAGLRDVRVLDGALDAWRALGRPLSTESPQPVASDITVSADRLPVVQVDEVLDVSGPLVDARGADQYLGQSRGLGGEEGGHIPGAISLPSTDLLDADGRFLPSPIIREKAAQAGIGTRSEAPVAYCGGGIVATHLLLGLAVAGIDGSLFPGSWSQWTDDPTRPVATGPTPAGDVHVPAENLQTKERP